MPLAEAIMQDNLCRKYSNKSVKTFSSTWLVTYDFDLEKTKQSKLLYELLQFKTVQQVKIAD